MKKWLKRIRGAVSTALSWAVAWGGVGAIIGLATGIYSAVWGTGTSSLILTFLSPTIPGLIFGSALFGSVFFAMCGFAGGAAFSVVLSVTEGRRRFDEMSLLRFAGWGAVGSFLLMLPLLLLSDPLALDLVFGISGVVALMGAGSAAGSLALARRADDRELLEGSDVADVGLTEGEAQELLGGRG